MTKLHRSIRKPAEERGFTLIELLVVIIILGILAAVVVFAVSGVGDKGKSSAVTIDERTIRTAEEAYCARNGRYGTGQELVTGGFLSELPEYHQVFVRNGSGSCNGWEYTVLRTAEASPDPEGSWARTSQQPSIVPVSLVRLADGRVLAFGASGIDFAVPKFEIWDPVTGTWTLQEDPPASGDYYDFMSLFTIKISPQLLLLKDDPATPGNECAGTFDNCNKVLALGSRLFDPERPVGSGQWQVLDLGPNCGFCQADPSNFELIHMAKVNGSPSQCGTACGRILVMSYSSVAADLYDPRDNSYTRVEYGPASNDAPQQISQNSMFSPLPDGRILLCCGETGRSVFFEPLSLSFLEGPDPDNGAAFLPTRLRDPQPVPVLFNGDIFFAPSGSRPDFPGLIYSPSAGGPGQFRIAPSCGTEVRCEPLTTLPDGRVLASRTDDNNTYFDLVNSTKETYLFSPARNAWTRAADLPARFNTINAAVTLTPAGGPCGNHCGKVLVAGFNESDGAGNATLFTP